MLARRCLLRVLAGSLAGSAMSMAPLAQARPRRLAILSWFATHRRDVLVRELGKLGYQIGRNLEVELGLANGETARADDLARSFASSGFDIIFADATPAVLAMKRATQEIPIVMSGADPVRSGIVGNLARPGGNITGFTSASTDVVPKRVEIAREIIPNLKRIGFLGSTLDPNAQVFARAIETASRALGIDVVNRFVRGPDEFEAAVAEIAAQGAGALYIQPLYLDYARDIIAAARARNMPAMGDVADLAHNGALFSYGGDRNEPMKIAAEYIDRILKGAKPGDLPIQQVDKQVLVINQLAAKTFGLTVPTSVLLRADEVIE
jgi:putative ABC transport system substrate-binding protein